MFSLVQFILQSNSDQAPRTSIMQVVKSIRLRLDKPEFRCILEWNCCEGKIKRGQLHTLPLPPWRKTVGDLKKLNRKIHFFPLYSVLKMILMKLIGCKTKVTLPKKLGETVAL